MLTKSDYTHRYLECPMHLWVWKHKQEEMHHHSQNPSLLWRFEEGNMVDVIARELFPHGVMIHGHGGDVQKQTQDQIKAGATTIFQAAAVADRIMAIADIIRFNPETKKWDIFEVKSSSEVKKEHIHDVCFQRMAFRKTGFDIGRVHLVYVNGDYLRAGAIDPQSFLIIKDITEEVDEVEDTVETDITKALAIIDNPKPKAGEIACTCVPKECMCIGHCYPGLPDHSIFELTRIGGPKAQKLYTSGVRTIVDLPEDYKLTTAQACQVQVARSGTPIVERDKISEALSKLKYPLSFLDYETFACAVPMFDGLHPHQAMAFQYSLHVLPAPGAELEHHEFLARNLGNTIPELAESLRSNLPDNGNVIVWYKGFETARNKEMAALLPAFAPFFESLNERTFDLMEIFSHQHYVHPDFCGSCSIKKVLPVLIPALSHKNLTIHEGMAASLSWYRMFGPEKSAKERDETWGHLIEYCELDTFAMVEIFRHLQNL